MTDNNSSSASDKVCVCYISDQGYLLPSLISSIQAKENISAHKADIKIYYVGAPCRKSDLFQSVYEKFGIGFVTVSPDAIDEMHIMFARLFVDRFIDPAYGRILYLDGDTQIAGSLDALVDAQLPAGMFCAARDPMSLAIDWKNRVSLAQRKYFGSIGLSINQVRSYFNSGVLLFERQSWKSISSKALLRVRSRDNDFQFPDQDALNLVAGDKCLTMSFKWNFPVFLLNSGISDVIEPRVFHFMSNPRPWQGSFEPWGKKWHQNYLNVLGEFPQLAPYSLSLSGPRYLKYFLQQHYKKQIETVTWRRSRIFKQISMIETDAFV
jgi:lipopolysaccharide biosynthesis glycosyltransferase